MIEVGDKVMASKDKGIGIDTGTVITIDKTTKTALVDFGSFRKVLPLSAIRISPANPIKLKKFI
jgi:hypothetical protein